MKTTPSGCGPAAGVDDIHLELENVGICLILAAVRRILTSRRV
jgi:hypothetical protein